MDQEQVIISLKNTNNLSKKSLKKLNKKKKKPFLNLPIDIIFTILSKLPLKSLSQCRYVSKTWYNFIHNPQFAQIHFTRVSSTLHSAVFLNPNGKASLLDPDYLGISQELTVYNVKVKNFKENFTLLDHWTCFEVVGNANGLICFAPSRRDYQAVPCYVCNPITGEYVILRKSPKIGVKHIGGGFGFDSVHNEYKVVRIVANSDDAEVYNVGSGKWREVKIDVLKVCDVIWMRQSNAFLNECIHWVPSVMTDLDQYDTILSFNMVTEKFSLITMPPRCNEGGVTGAFELIVLGKCLCIVDSDESMRSMHIWVMKEYGVHTSWVKESVFLDEVFFCHFHGCHEVMELEGDSLMLFSCNGDVRYCGSKRKSRSIKLCCPKGNSVDLRNNLPIYFIGSLISPKTIGHEEASLLEGGN